MFFLLGPVRTEFILSWLFPLTYLIHIAEDYWAGIALSTSPHKIRGANLTPSQFLALNGFGWILLTLVIGVSQQFKFRHGLLVSLASAITVSGLFHLKGAIKTFAYNPGLVSGVLLWIPLGLFTLIAMKDEIQPVEYWRASFLGIIIIAGVMLLARFGRKLFEK